MSLRLLATLAPAALSAALTIAGVVLFGLALIYRDGVLVIAAAVAGLVGAATAIFLIGSGAVALTWAASWFGL